MLSGSSTAGSPAGQGAASLTAEVTGSGPRLGARSGSGERLGAALGSDQRLGTASGAIPGGASGSLTAVASWADGQRFDEAMRRVDGGGGEVIHSPAAEAVPKTGPALLNAGSIDSSAPRDGATRPLEGATHPSTTRQIDPITLSANSSTRRTLDALGDAGSRSARGTGVVSLTEPLSGEAAAVITAPITSPLPVAPQAPALPPTSPPPPSATLQALARQQGPSPQQWQLEISHGSLAPPVVLHAQRDAVASLPGLTVNGAWALQLQLPGAMAAAITPVQQGRLDARLTQSGLTMQAVRMSAMETTGAAATGLSPAALALASPLMKPTAIDMRAATLSRSAGTARRREDDQDDEVLDDDHAVRRC